MKQQHLEELVSASSFAADIVAIEEISKGATMAQVNRRSIRRAIEFLYGNELIDVDTRKLEAFRFDVVNPPYPREIEE